MRSLLFAIVLAASAARADFLPKDPRFGETIAQTFCAFQSVLSIEPQRTADSLVMRMQMGDAFTPAGPPCNVRYTLHNDVPPGTYQVVQEGWGFSTFRRVQGSVTVSAGVQAVPAFTGLSGNWFDPAGPGRGLNIVQGASGALFVLWLDHGIPPNWDFPAPHSPSWLVMPSGRWITPTTFRGLLYSSRGSPANQRWDPAALTSAPFGFAALTFSNANELSLDADFVDTPLKRTATLKRFAF